MKKNLATVVSVSVLTLLAAFVNAGAASAQQRARILCSATDNGQSASGSVSVKQGDREIANGITGTAIAVPNGTYDVIVTLDGALDHPTVTSQVVVARAQQYTTTATFQTAVLQIQVEAAGRHAAGMATITRNGERVGTLGAGVPCHLSAGTYDIVVRYRSTERRFDGIALSPGEHRSLTASF
ncbi:MAG: hypothetical protein IPK60_05130 [Sandaracinaceae bacterium]|nr:hypothetical protein [Sandaracinaceae bacterium]